jgi:rRNA maturation protein Nop10
MSDRKYRQRGYQDDGARERQRAPAHEGDQPKTRPEDRPPGPRKLNMPGFRDLVRCHRCAAIVNTEVTLSSTCIKCGAALHSCAQCMYFNPADRYECMKTVPARIAPKDIFNTCELFEAKTTVERETGSARQTTPRSAFDDLFK